MLLRLIVGCLAFVAVAPIANANHVTVNSAILPGKYIVKLDKTTNLEAYFIKLEESHARVRAQLSSASSSSNTTFQVLPLINVTHNYNLGDFMGFAVSAHSVETLKTILQEHHEVVAIEADVSLEFIFNKVKKLKPKKSSKKGHRRSLPITTITASTAITAQKNSFWNLARISERQLNLKQPEYDYYSNGGAGINIYILDDGIDIYHNDFGGRAKWGYSVYYSTPNSGTGHGTLVAGVAAGTTAGVAKKANVIAVQVLDSSGRGTISGMIAGLTWIIQHAPRGSSVINMSIGVPSSYAGIGFLTEAVSAAVALGFPVFASAGDSAANACAAVPSGNPNVFTVAGTDTNDKPDPNSNFGSCVAMYAPGVNIITDWISTSNAQAMISGTSYAVPHVSGVAALFLAQRSFGPFDLYSAIRKQGTSSVIQHTPSNTPNLMLYNRLS